MKFKEIKLLPTLFTLDVFITNNVNKLVPIFEKRYGLTLQDMEGTQINEVSIIDSGKKSELKGHTRICLIMGSFNIGTIIHEMQHIIWKLSKLTNIELNYDSQEWQACFMEYLYSEIMKKNYTNI